MIDFHIKLRVADHLAQPLYLVHDEAVGSGYFLIVLYAHVYSGIVNACFLAAVQDRWA